MSRERIKVGIAEMTQAVSIWLTVIGQRRPALIRDLWNRKGETNDDEKRRFARRELAREIAERLETAKWEVTREPGAQEGWLDPKPE